MQRNDQYILDDQRNVIPATSTYQWGEWIENNRDKRIVKQEEIDGFWVSTVFLGLDHNYQEPQMGPEGIEEYHPEVFETMIFDRRVNGDNYSEAYCRRCSTWDQAVEQHKKAVLAVKKGEI